MTFITNRGLYSYKIIPFSLKNTKATYQKLVNKIFTELIGISMEVHINGILIKSVKAKDYVTNLEETFSILRQTNMMLNTDKCTFTVKVGKFLSFIVGQRGIEANSEKIQAILDIEST